MIILPSDATLPNNPRIGWRTVLADATITSDEAASGFPVSEISNSATYLKWKGETAIEQAIVMQFASAQTVDYIGIARHNLGTAGITYTLASSDDGSIYTTVATDEPADDNAIIHGFDSESATYYRLTLSAGTKVPEIAVIYLGKLLTLPRRIYVGHTPLPLGRRRKTSTGRSESGQFLGRVRRASLLESRVSMQNVEPDWYREHFDAFAKVADTTPFFWAWRPEDYEDEAGYAWAMEDIIPSNQRPNGMMQFDFGIQGVP